MAKQGPIYNTEETVFWNEKLVFCYEENKSVILYSIWELLRTWSLLFYSKEEKCTEISVCFYFLCFWAKKKKKLEREPLSLIPLSWYVVVMACGLFFSENDIKYLMFLCILFWIIFSEWNFVLIQVPLK